MVKPNEEAIFNVARGIPDRSGRQAYLDQSCGADDALRRRVELLLKFDEEDSDFLNSPVIGMRSETEGDLATMLPAAGAKIGSYRVLEAIGEGGNAVVFMAEQTHPVRRRVAMKIIRAGMDTKQVLARFEAERQALALMDHPNIATVLDAGTTDAGRPYFVMELVQGVPITRYCDEHRLSLRQRVELFMQVCQAVQHAHQKGIVHRDLKPSNVLVGVCDGRPLPKVIDFGVAKITSEQMADRTLFTRYGDVIGTLQYMSPEQAELNQLDVDTRSDVYSLGVILYELLTGTTPLEHKCLKAATLLAALRVVREVEPTRPSVRLGTTPELPAIAVQRGLEARKLSDLLKGDLDWIVMKALEKDRKRRYQTANELTADLRRYLADEPIEARPPSAGYRFRKFARRNRGFLAAASVCVLGVLVAVATLTTGTIVIGRALGAETQAKRDLGQTLQREWRDANYHRITLAHRELTADNLDGTLRLLGESPIELRGWEWHHLMRLCRVEPLILRDPNELHSVAFGPDGRQIAVACSDGSVKILDAMNGSLIHQFTGHTGYPFSVAFSPDGRHVASAAVDRTIRLWDLTAGRQAFQWPGHLGDYHGMSYAIAFSPDGTQLAGGDQEGFVTLWSTADGRQLCRLAERHEDRAACVAFSSDGRFLATGSGAGGLRLFDLATGQCLRRIDGHRMRISGVAFSRDGKWLATTGFDRLVKLWDLASDKPGRTLGAHAGILTGLAFSPDGQRLFSGGGEDRIINVFDLQTGREVLTLRGHTRMCQGLALSPDGLRLASAGADRTLRIWDARPLDGDQRQEFLSRVHESEVWSVAYSREGRFLVTSSWSEPSIMLWEARTGALLYKFTFPQDVARVFSASLSQDGRYVVGSAFTRDGTARVAVWELESRREVLEIRERASLPFTAIFDPTGRFLVRTGPGDSIQVRDATSSQVVGTVGRHERQIWAMTFSTDGTRLATAANDSTVRVWAWDPAALGRQREPELTLAVPVNGYANRVAFSSDGRRLATGGEESATWIWDTNTGARIQVLRGHTGGVLAVAFSPDGRWLATAGEDTTIRLWDAASGELRRTLRGHTSYVMCLAFSPDSRWLASGSRDRTMKIWEMHPANAGTETQRTLLQQNSGR